MKNILLLALSLATLVADASVVKFVVEKTEVYANGRVFGNTGTYEMLSGRIFGELNPKDSHNQIIQDIEYAPTNEYGFVEYSAQFVLLRPKNLSKSNGILFLSLPNRGNMFESDTTLLKRGYIYLWCAWQGDVLPGGKRLTMKVPVATMKGQEITGLLRTEYQVNAPVPSVFLSTGPFTGNTHHSYPTVTTDNTGLNLTKRVHESDERQPVSNADWAFSNSNASPFPGIPCDTMISVRNGFETQFIYELTYTAKNPLVMGAGFAAIRDITAFLKHEAADKHGTANPLYLTGLSIVKAALLQGVSQCSGFMRTYLKLGFNQSEDNRIVFEGMNAHVGPRRVTLNVRFGRPGGGGMQREDHMFPGNEAPFTWSPTFDPVSGIDGGILDRAEATYTSPKIVQTVSSTEYWQSRMSLRTTDPFGKTDLAIPSNVRIYLFSSTQHGPGSNMNAVSGFGANGNSYTENLRAIVIALEHWVLESKLPPDSRYPTIKKRTLVAPDAKSIGWHDVPGVPFSGKVNEGVDLDFGIKFNEEDESGIIQEPVQMGKQKYTILVPKVDADDNEVDGVRSMTARVPLGTYTGWSLRLPAFGDGDIAGLTGMFIPFKKTKAERIAAGDPRLSLEERYKNHEGYIKALKKAAEQLVKEGFLMEEDREQAVLLRRGGF